MALTVTDHSWAPSGCLQLEGSLQHDAESICELQTLFEEPPAAFFSVDVVALQGAFEQECKGECLIFGLLNVIYAAIADVP